MFNFDVKQAILEGLQSYLNFKKIKFLARASKSKFSESNSLSLFPKNIA
ncbi:MAG: hypothetical protein ACJAYJ_000675 [Saprospiraceae bacterium]|jgi:hypothetical protein